MLSIPSFLDLKNQMNVAAWQWRWARQGGSRFWSARPLQDLRNDEDRRRYRVIEFRRYQLSKRGPLGRVFCINAERTKRRANVAKWRIERARHG